MERKVQKAKRRGESGVEWGVRWSLLSTASEKKEIKKGPGRAAAGERGKARCDCSVDMTKRERQGAVAGWGN
jgi:hypothetical protein